MRLRFLATAILASALSSLAWAQEPIRTPSAPAPGSPGTATPQPYGQPATAPVRPQNSPPLLPPAGGQRQPGTAPDHSRDQLIPQLNQQLKRNGERLDGQQKP